MIEKQNLKRAIVYAVTSLATALAILFGLSCVQITTKTIESYTGKKNPQLKMLEFLKKDGKICEFAVFFVPLHRD